MAQKNEFGEKLVHYLITDLPLALILCFPMQWYSDISINTCILQVLLVISHVIIKLLKVKVNVNFIESHNCKYQITNWLKWNYNLIKWNIIYNDPLIEFIKRSFLVPQFGWCWFGMLLRSHCCTSQWVSSVQNLQGSHWLKNLDERRTGSA